MGVGLCTISSAMKVIFLRDLARQGPKISYWILHASDSIFRHSTVHYTLCHRFLKKCSIWENLTCGNWKFCLFQGVFQLGGHLYGWFLVSPFDIQWHSRDFRFAGLLSKFENRNLKWKLYFYMAKVDKSGRFKNFPGWNLID